MSDTTKKTNFSWEAGGEISDQNNKPLGGLRPKGLQKIIAAEPVDDKLRTEQQMAQLKANESVTYKSKIENLKQKIAPEELFIEESVSGISGVHPDEKRVKKLTDKGTFRQGFNRFDKK